MRTVRLITIPERIYEMQQAVRVRAEVIARNTDGTVQLRSAEGEITVRPERPDQFPPGQSVEIRIPAERPPRTAEIRAAPSERPAPSRGTQTDVDVRVSRPRAQEDKTAAAADLVGRIVRAVPLPASQVPPDVPPEQNDSALPPVLSVPALPPEFAQAARNLVGVKTDAIAKAAAQAILTALPAAPAESSETLLSRPAAGTPPTLSARTATTEIGRVLKGVLGLAPNGLQFPAAPGEMLPAPQMPGTGSALFQVDGLTAPGFNASAFGLFTPDAGPEGAALSLIPHGLRAGEAAAQVIGPVTGKDALAVALVFPAQAEDAPHLLALLEPGARLTPGSLVSLMPQAASPLHSLNFAIPDIALPASPLNPAILAAIPLGIPYFLTPEPWPVLQDIANLLLQTSAPIAQAFANMIPNPATPQQMAPAALFFIAAMRAGDIEGWLGGRATDAIRRAGRGDLITRLSQESSALSRLGTEPLGQEWKAASLPLSWQEQILKIPVYYKRSEEERDTGAERGESMVRFVINLDLSRMGKMQMDALYREAAKRFDLILRSSQPFTKAAEHDMRGLFAGALEDIGLHGEMGFQTGAEKWVTVQPDKLYEFSANF